MTHAQQTFPPHLFAVADRPHRGQEFAGLHGEQAAVRLRQRLVLYLTVAVC